MFLLACLLRIVSLVGAAPSTPGFSLLVVGDWGGDYHHRDHDTGDCPASEAQVQTAASMARVATRINASMVISVGDNIYEDGVPNVQSMRFQTLFENVYSAPPLDRLPFYLIAGNHDHDGNVSAQIAYSSVSPRWRFPSTYYNVVRQWTAASGEKRMLEILFIDTVELGGDDGACAPTEPEKADAQWNWIQSSLAASAADFLWVVGHYPIYSAGDDGSTRCLSERLLPSLTAHGAHYMSGHDHMLEHLVYQGVHMVVSGAGMECCYNPGNLASVPEGSIQYMLSGKHGHGPHIGPRSSSDVIGGYASMFFMEDGMQLSFHSQTGEDLYVAPLIQRRTAVPAAKDDSAVNVVV